MNPSVIGSWKLKTNENYEAFLKHVQYGWATRKAALISAVEVNITQIEGGVRKKVTSTFYASDDDVIPDGVQRTDKDGKKITHRIEDGALVTDIIGTIVNWTETTRSDPTDKDKLTTHITWKNADGTNGASVQHLVRVIDNGDEIP